MQQVNFLCENIPLNTQWRNRLEVSFRPSKELISDLSGSFSSQNFQRACFGSSLELLLELREISLRTFRGTHFRSSCYFFQTSEETSSELSEELILELLSDLWELFSELLKEFILKPSWNFLQTFLRSFLRTFRGIYLRTSWELPFRGAKFTSSEELILEPPCYFVQTSLETSLGTFTRTHFRNFQNVFQTSVGTHFRPSQE